MEILLPALQELMKLAVSAAVGAFTLNLAKRAKRRQEAPVQMSEYVERQIQRVIEEKDDHYTRREQEWRELAAELRAELRLKNEQITELIKRIDRLKNGGGNGGHAPNPPTP